MKRNYKYNIGDKIYCKDGSYNLILSTTTGKRGESAYNCQCDKKHLYVKYQSRLDTRCPYCINQKIKRGYNDIATTNKEMFSMIIDKDFTYTHHDASPEVTDFSCPFCGFIIKKSPHYVKYHGLRCPRCSSGYSYGERFMMNLLDALHIKYITQYSSKNAKWCGSYKYDFYLNDFDYIIEIHGMQHYKDTIWNTYKDEHLNDLAKESLAVENVKKYIVIDVKKSEFKYIKNSIINSNLINDLKFCKDNVDWNGIQKKSIAPIIEKIADRYNNYSKNISELSKLFHLSNPTIVFYLKEASLLNMVDYNPEEKREQILRKNHAMNSERGSKPLMCLEDHRVFRNAKLLQTLSNELYHTNLDFRAVSSVCNKRRKSYKNLTFEFVTREYFNKIKNSHPEIAYGDKFYIMEDVA